MWADPGTKPLVISSKNVFGMKKDYLQHPIQDEHKPSPPRLSAGSEAEKVKSCDISLDVSKSTFSHHIEVDYSLSTTLPSTRELPLTSYSSTFMLRLSHTLKDLD
jgi:hypothetical protein